LQELNSQAFENPIDVVENNIKITKYLRDIKNCKTIKFVKNKKGNYITIIEGEHKRYFRCYEYIECFNLYDIPKSEKMFYEAGLAIGKFTSDLSSYDIDEVKYTIEDFHNIEKSYEAFINAFEENRFFRKKFCLIESNIIIKNKGCFNNIGVLIKKQKIPIRIVHNDTKISNILYDEQDALTEEKIHAYWNAYMHSFIAELETHPIHYVLVKGFDDRHNRGSVNIDDNNLNGNIEDIIENSKENYTEEDVEDYIESIIEDKSSHNNEVLGVYDSIARLQDAYIIALQKLEEQHKNMTGLLGNKVAYIVKNEKIMINVFDEFLGKWYYNVKTDRLFLERKNNMDLKSVY